MNIDKYLGIVTNRLSFNYLAFQAVNLFCVIFAAVFALLPFGLFFNKDDGVFFSIHFRSTLLSISISISYFHRIYLFLL